MDILVGGVVAILLVLGVVLAALPLLTLPRNGGGEVVAAGQCLDYGGPPGPDGGARPAMPAGGDPVRGVREPAASAPGDGELPCLDSDDPVEFAMAEVSAEDRPKNNFLAARAGGSPRGTPATPKCGSCSLGGPKGRPEDGSGAVPVLSRQERGDPLAECRRRNGVASPSPETADAVFAERIGGRGFAEREDGRRVDPIHAAGDAAGTVAGVRWGASPLRLTSRARLVETPGQPPLYLIGGVSKKYGHGGNAVYALWDVSLVIGEGVTAITGPNGGGKTTLLHVLGALDVPTEGEVLYRGRPLPFGDPGAMNRFRARVPAFVLQDLNLFQDQSAVENVAFSLTRYGEPYGVAIRAAYEQLESLGIDRKQARRLPRNLSGGQRQRVAIARALLANRLGGAEVILADEPTASVDSNDAERVFRRLLELAHEQAVPVIVVTHNPALAQLADRVLLCEHGVLRDVRR